jgi:hypothetical protein
MCVVFDGDTQGPFVHWANWAPDQAHQRTVISNVFDGQSRLSAESHLGRDI